MTDENQAQADVDEMFARMAAEEARYRAALDAQPRIADQLARIADALRPTTSGEPVEVGRTVGGVPVNRTAGQ